MNMHYWYEIFRTIAYTIVAVALFAVIFAFFRRLALYHEVVERHCDRINQLLRLATLDKQPTVTDAARALKQYQFQAIVDKIHEETAKYRISMLETVLVLNLYTKNRYCYWRVSDNGLVLYVRLKGRIVFEWA